MAPTMEAEREARAPRATLPGPGRLVSYPPDSILAQEQVADWLGVSTRSVCLWAECREIPGIKIGRQWRFRESELRQWLESPSGERVRMFPNAKVSTARV